jgi:abhydrolase domain-containing protein 1/3
MKKLCALSIAGFFLSPYYFSDITLYHSPNCSILPYISKTALSFPFYSTPWLNLGLLHSYYSNHPPSFTSDFASVSHISYSRETLQFDDGGTYSLDWHGPKSAKILFIVPGLTGGSEAIYIKHLVAEGARRGFSCAVLHGRGISGTPLTVKHS